MNDTRPTPQVASDTRKVSLSDAEIGLIEDGLSQYRDTLAAFVERFDLCPNETLPPVPGGVIGTLYAIDAILMKLEGA